MRPRCSSRGDSTAVFRFKDPGRGYEFVRKEGSPPSYVVYLRSLRTVSVSPESIELELKGRPEPVRIPRGRVQRIWATPGPRELNAAGVVAGVATAIIGGGALGAAVAALAGEKKQFLYVEYHDVSGGLAVWAFNNDAETHERLVDAIRTGLRVDVDVVSKEALNEARKRQKQQKQQHP